jgi:putative membrane protein
VAQKVSEVNKTKEGIVVNLFVNFASYLGLAVLLLLVGTVLFEITTTKVKEFELISQKNQTAALSLGGKIVGLALVLGAAAEYSISLVDMAIWGVIGIISQIIVFILAELLTIRFSISKAIEEDNRAVGIMLFTLSLSVGWIVAKCLSY